MTFYEAALRVLESAGQPLHVAQITERSIEQSLLSHVGKTPEQTMLSRLAAMARRPRDRRVIVTAKDTFALIEWAIPEDPEALAQTGLAAENPEEDLPPLRPAERHPMPRQDNVRATGRGERKRRRDEEEEERGGRRRRYPPVPEVAFEILSEVEGGLRPDELISRARERALVSDELSTEKVLTALLEDNQRRIDAGRRPQYALDRDSGKVFLERAGAPAEAPPLDLQAAFAAALGIPLEAGRPLLSGSPEMGASDADIETATQALKTAAKDARKAVARAIRRRLADAEVGTLEKSCVRMLHGLGFREVKVAKRSKDGPLLTSRKREGSVELRYAIRLSRGRVPIDRRAVQDLRKDLGHYAAQVGLLLGPGDVRGDARSEAQSSGALVMLWCADALGEKFLDAEVGVQLTSVSAFQVDERFFDQARVDAAEAARKREERHRLRDEARGAPAHEAEAVAPIPVAAAPAGAPVAANAEGEEGEGEQWEDVDLEGDEADDDLEAASAFASGTTPEGAESTAGGERRRRRRRRRGRRGRSRSEGSAQVAAAAGSPSAGPSAPVAEHPSPSAEPSHAPPPPAEPAGGSEQ